MSVFEVEKLPKFFHSATTIPSQTLLFTFAQTSTRGTAVHGARPDVLREHGANRLPLVPSEEPVNSTQPFWPAWEGPRERKTTQSSLTSDGFFLIRCVFCSSSYFFFLLLLLPPSASSSTSAFPYRDIDTNVCFLIGGSNFPQQLSKFLNSKKNGICDCQIVRCQVLPTTTTVLTPNLPGGNHEGGNGKVAVSHAPQLLKLFWNLPFCHGLWFGRHFGWEILSHHFCFCGVM